jgi:hypothetical protein
MSSMSSAAGGIIPPVGVHVVEPVGMGYVRPKQVWKVPRSVLKAVAQAPIDIDALEQDVAIAAARAV